jgi:hypothetical protein
MHFIDDMLWHMIWYLCTWLMHMGIVHGWHMMYLVDVLFTILYSLLTYIFLHDLSYGTSFMHGHVQGSS